MKNKRVLIIVCSIVVLLSLSTVLISYIYVGVLNPVSTLWGMMKVTLFECDYEEIQSSPKVIIANPDFELDTYMQSQPYKSELCDITDLQDQIIYTYNVGEGQELIELVEHEHFVIWKWR